MQTSKRVTNAINIELIILGLSSIFWLSTWLTPNPLSIWNILISAGASIGYLLVILQITKSSKVLTYKASLLSIGTYLGLGLVILYNQIQQLQLTGNLLFDEKVLLILGIELLLSGIVILVMLLNQGSENSKLMP